VRVSPDDGLDERFWGPTPDSVTAAEAVVAELTEQFAQRDLAANSIVTIMKLRATRPEAG
jgi:hypothetical protein